MLEKFYTLMYIFLLSFSPPPFGPIYENDAFSEKKLAKVFHRESPIWSSRTNISSRRGYVVLRIDSMKHTPTLQPYTGQPTTVSIYQSTIYLNSVCYSTFYMYIVQLLLYT